MVDSIVFDLDKTLIYTSSSSVRELYRSGILEDSKFFPAQRRIYYFDLPSSRPSRGNTPNPEGVSSMWGTIRPFAREFLTFCFKRFRRVIVFTAGTHDYALAICDVLFRGISKPYMIWARGHCVRVQERAADVDKRLVDLGYYPSLSVPIDSPDVEHMNAKFLERVARAVSEIEGDESITKNQFIIVEDNYHSFITHDYHNAFLIPAYESSSRVDPTAKPGSPGYSPARQKHILNEGGMNDDGSDEDDGDDGGEDLDNQDLTSKYSLADIHLNPTPEPIPIRKNAKYNWLLYPDETLRRLQTFIDSNPYFTAEEYTEGWNKIN